jgi:hypothetical protein
MANVGSGSYHFTEDEVEDIFNSMRLHKKNTTIHWHHFLPLALANVLSMREITAWLLTVLIKIKQGSSRSRIL